MKLLSDKIKLTALIIALSLGMAATGCSTGTGEGETNVEESDGKDKNPNEHNQTSSTQPVLQDSAKMDDAYERTDPDKGVRDRDNDGQADQ
jgi:hypothetical protein